MLWEVEIQPREGEIDREGQRVLADARSLGISSLKSVRSARSFLIEGDLGETQVKLLQPLLVDGVVENAFVRKLPAGKEAARDSMLLNVLFKPGVTDNVGQTARQAISDLGVPVSSVATCRKYYVTGSLAAEHLARLSSKVLANDAIEHVVTGPLPLSSLAIGSEYQFKLVTVGIRGMSDADLAQLSKEGQLYLSLTEMQTIQSYFKKLDRDPTDIELETVAQTWSEHCSHKTLRGKIRYRDENGERQFENLLKETVFAATQTLREKAGTDDWCVSVFRDNAGVVKFTDEFDICMKVETHNHPSAIEPYGGANTGMGGVIRDPMGTGMGAKPICSTDVFCFAPPDVPFESLPAGVLHPRTVMRGVVSGVRDYGNRMGIPTVNGAVFFDERYLGNPLVYCGNVALLPVGMAEKHVHSGDYVVAVGGRTGRDGIHGATFSSAELTHESETLSGGAVQIGNAVVEKMVLDVVLAARDKGLFNAITDCGAGGFSSAVGEMGEETGADVWLEKCPLKYAGLSYTEIWISEAQERMVLAVSPKQWDEFHKLCASEGVEATVIGQFRNDRQLVLNYNGQEVGRMEMEFLHEGRPPVVREATFKSQPAPAGSVIPHKAKPFSTAGTLAQKALFEILGSLNVCSKEWIIRQYDHEVQGGSVVKPLVGVHHDGPSDAAVVRPTQNSPRGIVISNGMNPRYGDYDPYWMACSAIDEALRNCVATGADPQRTAILDNFCWGNTEKPETLGSLVRAAIGCHDAALAFETPFVSGKDSLNNEFTYVTNQGSKTIAIPSSLLISAMGQIEDVAHAVTMDLKKAGNELYLVGSTAAEFGGSHLALVLEQTGTPRPDAMPPEAWNAVPKVDLKIAPKVFAALHSAMKESLVQACHDLSEGGLAVALAEMAFTGGLGVAVEIASAAGESKLSPLALLYSESNTRFVVEVAPQNREKFLSRFSATGGVTTPVRIGTVSDTGRVVIKSDNATVIDADIEELRSGLEEAAGLGLRQGFESMIARMFGAAILMANLVVPASLLPAQDKAPIILAHRGGAHEFEENTMEGFRACYERGIRGFETDVRMTRDGALVILHDDTLDRTHSATGSVENMTAAELKDVVTKKGQKLLFLDELLGYFADKPGVYIEWEMKTSNKMQYPDERIAEYCQKVHSAIEARKASGSTYVYTSFDERPLKAMHAIDAKAPMSLIASKPCSAEFIQKAKAVGADRIACQINGSSRAAVREAQKSGLMVNGWPGRGAQDYYLAIGLGLDVHCTDVPVAVIGVKEQMK